VCIALLIYTTLERDLYVESCVLRVVYRELCIESYVHRSFDIHNSRKRLVYREFVLERAPPNSSLFTIESYV